MLECLKRVNKIQRLIFTLIIIFSSIKNGASNIAPYRTDRPLWELGLGLMSYSAHHYRGSDQRRDYLWPIPYFIYRGEFIDARNSGLVGDFFRKESITLKVSLNVALRVSSGRNKAREGMPNLDPSLEVGPMFSWEFWRSENKKHELSFNIPVRSVMAVEFVKVEPIGFFSVPFIAFTSFPQKMTLGLYSQMTIATMFGSQGYHDYYYGVSPAFTTEGRSGHRGKDGYSGSHVTWYLSKAIKRFHAFGFVRYDYLEGAVFEESPLYRKNHFFSFGAGVVWYFFQSEELSKRKGD